MDKNREGILPFLRGILFIITLPITLILVVFSLIQELGDCYNDQTWSNKWLTFLYNLTYCKTDET